MAFYITVQQLSKAKHIPSTRAIKRIIHTVLSARCQQAEITIRIVNSKESLLLNQQYRCKSGPTNVLSFVYETDPVVGDIVLCAPLIFQQARDQYKPIASHWTHLIIHGCLHLLGYDHIKKRDAKIMEALEIDILNQLGYENPYVS